MKTKLFIAGICIWLTLNSFSQGPTASICCDTAICSGASATLTASGGGTYLWINGDTSQSITVSPLTSTAYCVTVTDANGSTDDACAVVTVVPGPVAIVSASSITIASGSSATLTASGGGGYNWSPITGLSCTNCSSPIAAPSITTVYCVTVVDANGCTDISCITITVTPNGINEAHFSDFISAYPNPSRGKFTIERDGGELEIYNVLGEKILSQKISTAKSEIDLSKQPNGIYFLTIKTEQGIANKKLILNK